jgi:hypothetical protein
MIRNVHKIPLQTFCTASKKESSNCKIHSMAKDKIVDKITLVADQ